MTKSKAQADIEAQGPNPMEAVDTGSVTAESLAEHLRMTREANAELEAAATNALRELGAE